MKYEFRIIDYYDSVYGVRRGLRVYGSILSEIEKKNGRAIPNGYIYLYTLHPLINNTLEPCSEENIFLQDYFSIV